MAEVTTTFTVNSTSSFMRFRSFTNSLGIADAPAREAICAINAGAIPLTGVGDNQLLVVDVNLPLSKSYRVAGVFFRINAIAGAAHGFANQIAGSFKNKAIVAEGDGMMVPIEWVTQGTAVQGSDIDGRYYSPADLPGILLSPEAPGDAVSLHVEALNSTANDTAYLLRFFARFLEYDPAVALDWSVNRQVPVFS